MVYVIRHGDKAKGDFYNPRLRHQDQPLSRLGRRQARALLFTEKADPAKNIILVSHEGIIRCFIAELLGIPAFRRFLFVMDTACTAELGWEEDHKAWRLLRMNNSP